MGILFGTGGFIEVYALGCSPEQMMEAKPSDSDYILCGAEASASVREEIDMSWTKAEKKHARALFDLALEREYKALMDEINALHIESRDEVWELRDRLNRKAREMDRKYDYRYSQLMFVFAELFREGYLTEEELSVLGEDKMNKIVH